ncbi:MAG: hypothetical protein P8J29_06985, partial [Rhodospirillales bacterium]|nr:hypothetical protein [Rhodospirillales bacterium]
MSGPTFKPARERRRSMVFTLGKLVGLLAVAGIFFAPAPAMAGNPSAQIGNYLAGRHAQNIQDPLAAIEFYRAALKSDPGNLDIQIRIFSILVSEG